MKDANGFALKFGALLAGISAICGILVFAAPELTRQIAVYLTHNGVVFTQTPLTPEVFVIGTVLWGIIGVLIGWIIAKMC
ncbi:MAG: hypothetical protein HY917_03395 [Candidatus Diapherotrites archaeon]|nr:hypothetical protein [Candidatus Diapherotrites archaeon]